jgi:preprotein translocase subunit YajC
LKNLFLDAPSALLAAAAPGESPSPFGMVVPMVLMLVIVYFMMIRPSSQQRKRHDEMMKSLKRGDKIVASGMIATVVSVGEKTVTIRSADTKLEVLRSAVTEVLEKSAATSEP